ncbi:MAG: orotate phosphoribosyltransferase [Robiginitomaculum sp.]|nr:MAG: orotate phosphoribosyltransferase [Robiginitomaculum sp.]
MNTQQVLEEFKQAGALLEGHFTLSSGRHSPFFLQKAFVFMDPVRTERLCRALAEKVRQSGLGPFDVIVSPAVGGLIPGYETARHLGLVAMYVEREDGKFVLRRGFTLQAGAKVLIVEDIVTTGLSSRECIDAVRALGGDVLAEACLIDRSGGKAEVGAPLLALAEVDFPTYAPDEIPADMAAIPAIKPGSRDLGS